MSRVALILSNKETRERAARWVMAAPPNCRFELKESKRSVPQNSLLWVYLTEIARQLEWHGQKYSPDDWKDYMMHAMKRARWMPSEDGGMVPIGMRTSDLSKSEMAELLALIEAFAAQHGIALGGR